MEAAGAGAGACTHSSSGGGGSADRDRCVESRRYYQARMTTLKMLMDRGYAIPPSDLDVTFREFREWWESKPKLSRLTISAALRSDPSYKVLVIFCSTQSVKMATIRGLYEEINGEECSRLILVLQSKITVQARQAIRETFNFKVETFQITDLLVNITKHVLKPKHEILSAAEKAEVLNQYNVKETQIPYMLGSDPVARYYGLEKGSVVRVSYEGDLTGNHVTYRCVV